MESHRWDARLSLRDAADLEARVPTIVAAMPVMRLEGKVKWRRRLFDVPILGVDEEFPRVRDHGVAAGRFITRLDVERRFRVAVVGAGLVSEVFGGRDPRGQGVYIEGQRFEVVGVLQPKGRGMAEDIDRTVLIPVTTAQRISGSTRLSEIWAKAAGPAAEEAAVVQVSRIFRKRFGIRDAGEGAGDEGAWMDEPYPGPRFKGGPFGGYYGVYHGAYYGYGPGLRVAGGPFEPQPGVPPVTVTSVREMVAEAEKARRVMTLMLGGIAGISLLVGGLGIMNMMMVSVSERTREIGLQMAMGAKTLDLVYQFMAEAVLLCALGGMVGLLAGRAGADPRTRW